MSSNPHPLFDSEWYLQQNPDVAAAGINPLQHYMTHGWREGRDPNPLFDTKFYLEQNPDVAAAGENPLSHYYAFGWKEGRNPHPDFAISWYLDRNLDLREAGVEPLGHYLARGSHEGRQRHPNIEPDVSIIDTPEPSAELQRIDNPSQPQSPASLLNHYHSYFSNKGPAFEEFDPTILNGDTPDVKLLAFYLPQFHAIPENDKFWGPGFTEWRQLARGLPRFPGHYQPRIPRDHGFYDLSDINTMSRQIAAAKAAGIHGFGFYYYWFNGRRILHKPVEQFLDAGQLAMPFFIIWANENWTRTWDGMNANVLLHQDYRPEDERALLADLSRHFRDERYIKLAGRPLFVIYKPSDVPDPKETFARWREIWQSEHGMNPLIFMAQTFGYTDPLPFGLDGALEFPPHKLTQHLHGRPTPDAFDPEFNGRVISYDDFSEVSTSEIQVEFPLIKTAVPSWDNDARRPMRGLTLEGSSPKKYEAWLKQLVERTAEHKVFGERLVAINAWNEWAEGAYLEPDVHFGAAYLNATARAVKATLPATAKSPKTRDLISVIIPNYNHAKYLPTRIGSILSQSRKPDQIVFLDDDSSDNSVEIAETLLSQSSIPYVIIKNSTNSGNVFKQWIKGLDAAVGNLIWIAESDDDARTDFLALMEQSFVRQDVLLSYCRIKQIDADGQPTNDLDHYYDDLPETSWSNSKIVPAHKTLNADFAIKNIIPNASGAVFRKPQLNDDERSRLFSYTFAGDWFFYALISRGGSIAYRHDAESYFRKHRGSVSQNSIGGERHIREHRMILDDLRSLYGIDGATVQRHIAALSKTIGQDASNSFQEALSANAFSPVENSGRFRICIAAYSFDVGGGELLPIELANTLRSLGHHVTYMTLETPQAPTGGPLRHRLRDDIPVVLFDDVASDFIGFLSDHGVEVFNSHNVAIEYQLHRRSIEIPVPYIASLHGGYETVPQLLTNDFIDYVARNVDTWLYLSEKNLEPLVSRGLRNANFVRSHNAVATPCSSDRGIAAARDRYRIPRDAFVLVLASRAIREKGWQVAIDVTTALRAQTGQNCILLLLGDGPDLEALRNQNLSKDYVRFLGHVDNPGELIALSDLGIFPSTFSGETFPLFVLECLQHSLPVIATDVGEIKNILRTVGDRLAGHVVPRHQQSEILERSMSAVASESLRNKVILDEWRQAAAAAAKKFTMDGLAGLYMNEFVKLRASASTRS